MKKILSIFVILMMMAMTAWAEDMTQPSGSGTSSDPYLISKATEFEWFANQVNGGTNTINAKLTADINLGNNQTMIGTSDHKFAGTFDGNGHTVTVAYSSEEDDYTALFRYVDGATISHLNTSGTITSNKAFSAGIVSYCANSTVNCCSSNVSITCSIDGFGDNGGIVALVPDTGNSSVTVSNCLFNGTFSGDNAKTSGGIVGWVRSTTTISGCLSMINGTFHSTCACTIAYAYSVNYGANNDYLTISNCYYTTAYGTIQGTATTTEKLASGEACYGLNGGKTDGTQGWYQNLNNGQTADAQPTWISTHGTVLSGEDACPSTATYSNLTHTFNNMDGLTLTCANDGCSYSHTAPFRLTAQEDGNVKFVLTGSISATLEYTKNLTNAWTAYTYDTDIALNNGESVYFRALGTNGKNEYLCKSSSGYISLASTCNVAASGNIRSLISTTATVDEQLPEGAFRYFFKDCIKLTQAPILSGTLSKYCYYGMFQGCTGLTSIPSLPSTELREECYYHMFNGCTNVKINTLGLGTAWSIPAGATTVSGESDWNSNMFTGTAGNFTDAPEIGTTYYVLDKPYSREMTNNWGTLVLPFDITYDASNTNYNLYYLSAADNVNLTFTEYASGKINAGTPMAVKKLSGDAIEIEPASNSTFSTTITSTTAVDGLSMNGTYTNVTDKTGVYFIAQDKFWKAETAITIAPFRAWFEGTPTGGSAKSFNIVEGDELTGISQMENGEWKTENGKYLENGRVVIVKNGVKYNTAGQRVF